MEQIYSSYTLSHLSPLWVGLKMLSKAGLSQKVNFIAAAGNDTCHFCNHLLYTDGNHRQSPGAILGFIFVALIVNVDRLDYG